MKKCFAVVMTMLTVLMCFSACGDKKIYTDPSAYSEAASKSEVEASVSESEQVDAIADDKVKTEKEIGKSVENEKLVVRRDGSNSTEYWVYYFNKFGKSEYKISYIYCTDDSSYQSKLENLETGNDKITDSDDNLRCIVVKSTGIMQMSYKQLYYQYVDQEFFTIL